MEEHPGDATAQQLAQLMIDHIRIDARRAPSDAASACHYWMAQEQRGRAIRHSVIIGLTL